MLLYHFTSKEYGLQSIKNQHIKLSKFDDLNDPFELIAAGSNEVAVRNLLRKSKIEAAKRYRLLCSSKSWMSPLLWSHYGDRHKGLALILEVEDVYVRHVIYEETRNLITEDELLIMTHNLPEYGKFERSLLETKAHFWSYEDEARVIFDFKDTIIKDGLSFIKCGEKVKIVGIISGPLCSLSESDIKALLPKSPSCNFIFTQARLAFKSFKVVADQRKNNISIY